jgi:hypothetical protein
MQKPVHKWALIFFDYCVRPCVSSSCIRFNRLFQNFHQYLFFCRESSFIVGLFKPVQLF